MFEIGWTEMLVIAIVMIVVVGPKDLPQMLRTIGKFTAKMTSMAGDFRKQFDEALREAELDDVKTTIDSARKLNPAGQLREALNPMQKAADDVRRGLDLMNKPKPPSATSGAVEADPLKTGAAAIPGEGTATAAAAASATSASAAATASSKPNGAANPTIMPSVLTTPAPTAATPATVSAPPASPAPTKGAKVSARKDASPVKPSATKASASRATASAKPSATARTPAKPAAKQTAASTTRKPATARRGVKS